MDDTVSQSRLDSVLATAVDGIVVIDERARIMVFNRACENLFGYKAEDVLGKNVSIIMSENDSHAHDGYMHHYMSTGERRIIGIGREVMGRHKDGTVFPVELSVGEARTPDGRQFIGIMRDVRARKNAERRIAQLQAQLVHLTRVNAMDEMGAAIAHELNQPLTAVMLYLQVVMRRMDVDRKDGEDNGPRDAGLDAMLLDTLKKAVNEAERAGRIIQRMRQFIEKREPERKGVDLEKLIDEALELTALGGATEGIDVRRDQAPRLVPVQVDAVQIQQVLVNLLRNALEAVRGSTKPWIRIKTSLDGDGVVVEIEDGGPGIPKELVPNLFKAFSTSKRTGMGLGLSISRSIVQNHGGDLKVDPGGNGRGARFIMTLTRSPDV